jgi:hypothetical protein
MAMRLGMARGAVRGNQDTRRAHVVSTPPMAANETTKARTRTMVTGPVTLEASSVLDASEPSMPYTVAYRA